MIIEKWKLDLMMDATKTAARTLQKIKTSNMNTQPIITEAEENKRNTTISCKIAYNEGLDHGIKAIKQLLVIRSRPEDHISVNDLYSIISLLQELKEEIK